MNVIEYLSLSKSYQTMATILAKEIHCGDENEEKHINNLKLKDISDFLQSKQIVICNTCCGKGEILKVDSIVGGDFVDEEVIRCPTCNGSGGYFKEFETDCNL